MVGMRIICFFFFFFENWESFASEVGTRIKLRPQTWSTDFVILICSIFSMCGQAAADAKYYGNTDVYNILKSRGAKVPVRTVWTCFLFVFETLCCLHGDRLTNWYFSITLENQEDANDRCKSSRSSRVWAQSIRASSSKEWWYHKGCPFSPLFLDSAVLKLHVCFSVRLVYVKVWGEWKAVSLHLLYGAMWENYKSLSSSTEFKHTNLKCALLLFKFSTVMTDDWQRSLFHHYSNKLYHPLHELWDWWTNQCYFFFPSWRYCLCTGKSLFFSEFNLLYA